jgi:hypothetical protein
MKRYAKEELRKIIENHQHWLNEDCENWEGMRANLSYVDLSKLDLSDTNLRCADLHYANLYQADLRGANLRGADLHRANLRCADLHYVNLCNADLYFADLNNAKNIPFIPIACPDIGSFIGYKKAGKFIVKLKILSDARRCSATGRKCRCDKAKVLDIQYFDKDIPCDYKEVASNYDKNFIYRIGEIVEEPNFDENRWNECTRGIHFFINRQEAVGC